jgi:transcriptional regulator with XRE-family HTH domain
VDLAERLAESLRKLRQQAGITQKDLAKRLGMSPATLNRLERGTHNATLKTIDGLCSALKCDPAELFRPGRLRLPSRRP